MGSGEDFSSPPIPPVHLDTARAERLAAEHADKQRIISQQESRAAFQSWADEAAFTPTLVMGRFQSLEEKRKRIAEEKTAEKAKKEEKAVLQIRRLEEKGREYNRKNPELQTRSLLLLRARISDQDSREDILSKVLEMYPDPSLADEALDFLLDTTEGQLTEKVREAKERFNAQFAREIKAGKNIAEQARAFSMQGLGSPTGLRNLYREVTGNPREAGPLFEELSSQFDYEHMKTVIDFLLHSMGGDLKSKGSSIDRAELHRLFVEARKLQGILGIFRFFKSRMNLILNAFRRQGLELPLRITFELLAKLFMKAVQERYPSVDKILLLGSQMGLSNKLLAQIILYTQMRDAVRQTAPRLFKSDQHRQDVLNAFIETIEELDEQLEEEEEEES